MRNLKTRTAQNVVWVFYFEVMREKIELISRRLVWLFFKLINSEDDDEKASEQYFFCGFWFECFCFWDWGRDGGAGEPNG